MLSRPLVAAWLAAVSFTLCAAHASNVYVSPEGSDANSGLTPQLAFRSIGRAAETLKPGDTCWIRAGTYREGLRLVRSGSEGHPITFSAFNHERVVLDGSDLVEGSWTAEDHGIWNTSTSGPVTAVYCDGRMMVEARWPNCTWSDNWKPDKKWALTDGGSSLGQIKSAAIAESGQDLSGGLVYIKLSKGNSCYTRKISSHQSGSAMVPWDASGLPSRIWREDGMPERIEKFGFAKNRFFVVAAGALDAPEEWWYDAGQGRLRFITPDGKSPALHQVSVQRRESAFSGSELSDVTFRGLEFRGCNLRFASSHRLTVDSCSFAYPSYLREFENMADFKENYHPIWLQGDGHVIEHCEISWALETGLLLEGNGNRIEDCVIHDVNLDGAHPGPGISVLGVAAEGGKSPMPMNVIRNCTIYNFGGVGIYAYGQGPARVDHNHLFNGGLYCTDVSSLYIPTGERMGGSMVDHNWIHDHHGIGFRVDQLGRDITFHHNLVWDTLAGCKAEGVCLVAYNNTVMADDPATNFPFLVVYDKSATPEEVSRWRIQNNVAFDFLDRIALKQSEAAPNRPRIIPLEERPGRIDHNVAFKGKTKEALFVDPSSQDFHPKSGGPLNRSGVAVMGAAESTAHAPSIGALEPGDDWTAGADWLGHAIPVPKTPHEASVLARSLRSADIKAYGPAQQ